MDACFLCAALAAEPTCKFLNVSLANHGSPSPVELGLLAAVVGNAIAAHQKSAAAAFPVERDGLFGMMKGGALKTVGYSKDGHANQPGTFSDCLAGGCRRCCAALCRRSIDAGAWRALTTPPARLPHARLPSPAALLQCQPGWPSAN